MPPINCDLRRRTPGEELWLARKAAGKTSLEAAALAGVGKNRYAEVERDVRAAPTPFKTGICRVSSPSLALLLVLARRRSGFGFARTAAALSISRVTLSAAERRGDPALVRFWRKRGFRFPAGIVN